MLLPHCASVYAAWTAPCLFVTRDRWRRWRATSLVSTVPGATLFVPRPRPAREYESIQSSWVSGWTRFPFNGMWSDGPKAQTRVTKHIAGLAMTARLGRQVSDPVPDSRKVHSHNKSNNGNAVCCKATPGGQVRSTLLSRQYLVRNFTSSRTITDVCGSFAGLSSVFLAVQIGWPRRPASPIRYTFPPTLIVRR